MWFSTDGAASVLPMDAPLVYLEEGFTSSLYEQSLDDQIQNLKNDGVRFTIINEARAKEYLSQRINLFKLKRFAINYRQIDGRYEGLDFAYLVDLASIDYQIRLFCGYIAGRVEHDLKLRFNHLLMIDAAHDGFDIARLIDRDAEFVFNDDSDYQILHTRTHTFGIIFLTRKSGTFGKSLTSHHCSKHTKSIWAVFIKRIA